jgi:hypothetical protein
VNPVTVKDCHLDDKGAGIDGEQKKPAADLGRGDCGLFSGLAGCAPVPRRPRYVSPVWLYLPPNWAFLAGAVSKLQHPRAEASLKSLGQNQNHE